MLVKTDNRGQRTEDRESSLFVIPAKAGIQKIGGVMTPPYKQWIPACAGMTEKKAGMTEKKGG